MNLTIKKTSVIAMLLAIFFTSFNTYNEVYAVEEEEVYPPTVEYIISGTGATVTIPNTNYKAWWNDGVRKTTIMKNGIKETVFCIEPFVAYLNGPYHKATDFPHQEQEELSLIQYYGWELSSKTDLDYAITQYMLWEYYGVSIDWDIKATEFAKTYATRKAQIESKINKVNLRPSFALDTITLKKGESKTITDTNGVFTDYVELKATIYDKTKKDYVVTDKVTVTKNGNNLTIKANDYINEEITITAQKYKLDCIGTSVAYKSAQKEGQDVGIFYVKDPSEIKVKVNIEKQKGSIKVIKYEDDGIENSYTGKLVEGTKFVLSANADMSSPIGTYTTDKNGVITIEGIEIGDYYLQETSTQAHLEVDSTIHPINVKDGETTTKNIHYKDHTNIL